MYEEGYENITNIDFSNTVISYMDSKCKLRNPKMCFKVMDVLDLNEFREGDFNVVIDKGTLDCVLCGDISVSNANKMLSEVHRVLAPGGFYICITYGEPKFRMDFFKIPPSDI